MRREKQFFALLSKEVKAQVIEVSWYEMVLQFTFFINLIIIFDKGIEVKELPKRGRWNRL